MVEKTSRDLVPGLGAALRAARERAGLTLDDVASQVGTGRAAISKVELEQRAPSARLLFALADALGVPLDELRAMAASASGG